MKVVKIEASQIKVLLQYFMKNLNIFMDKCEASTLQLPINEEVIMHIILKVILDVFLRKGGDVNHEVTQLMINHGNCSKILR